MNVKLNLILVLSFLVPQIYVMGQHPVDSYRHSVNSNAVQNKAAQKILNPQSEICGNNIDDDGNGLIDIKDFSCYFNTLTPDSCIPTRIVWATFQSRLYWVDLDTNDDSVINFPLGEFYDDITWTPSGNLYGAERFSGQIRQINPYNGQTQFASNVAGHYYTNGMTSDAQGNLFLCSYTNTGIWHIVKLNLATQQTTIIADLTANNLESAGDLTFLNGFLYVSCMYGKIAKIDIGTGVVQTLNINGSFGDGYGLITLGDGYLYISSANNLFRLNPATMQSTYYYQLPTYGFIYGLSSYCECCNAPGCHANVNISVQTNPPFCSNTGVLLVGHGSGINDTSDYTWALPNGQTQDGDSLTAFISGKYYLRYHTIPDTCGDIDSIDLTILHYPSSTLGNDSFLCTGDQLLLHPIDTIGVTSYLWQDGSTAPQYTVVSPGLYWLQAANVCGASLDTILIKGESIPQVALGNDTLLCPQTTIVLKNLRQKQQNDNYLWSTNSTSDSIRIYNGGLYWLQSSNSCGLIRDSIWINMKDSCICNPFYPKVELGPDKEICQYDTAVLQNLLHVNGFRYTWQDGSTSNNFTVRTPGTYWVVVSTYCGDARDTVIINQKTDKCECLLFMPTAFTPNHDGKNDLYKPLSNCGLKGDLQIFNRWGNLVYVTRDLYKGWDGNYSGVQQPGDIFVYLITYRFGNRPGVFTKKGVFALIR